MILDKGNMILNETIWDFFFTGGRKWRGGKVGILLCQGFLRLSKTSKEGLGPTLGGS